jgi:hypothetical protein
MQYVLLIYQGTLWGALPNLSDDEKNAIVGEYGEINNAPGVTPGLPLGLPEDATTVRVQDGKTPSSDGPYIGIEEPSAAGTSSKPTISTPRSNLPHGFQRRAVAARLRSDRSAPTGSGG